MEKRIRVEVFKFEDDYRLVVYVNNNFYTQSTSKNLKQLLIDAHDYLTADL